MQQKKTDFEKWGRRWEIIFKLAREQKGLATPAIYACSKLTLS